MISKGLIAYGKISDSAKITGLKIVKIMKW